MEKNYLRRVLENEDRVNKLVEVLALSPARHFQVSYSSVEISLTAFTRNMDDATQVEDLMRIFASSTDKLEMRGHENEDGKFQVISLSIPLDQD